MPRSIEPKEKMPKITITFDDLAEAEQEIQGIEIRPVRKLHKDIMLSSLTLGKKEAGFLVDTYYSFQKLRLMNAAKLRALIQQEKPSEVMDYMQDEMKVLEAEIRGKLQWFAESDPVGQWLLGIRGIGPVLASGLLAYFDVTDAPYVGQFWSYAGLLPDKKWERGQKRPWCTEAKNLCFLIGESFVKTSNRDDDIYGHIYKKRKELEIERNNAMLFADQARDYLQRFNIRKDTDAYKYYSAGKLPPAHIHARAKRVAVKLFIAHFHHVAYFNHFKQEPPMPFANAHLEHEDYIPPPNFDPMEFNLANFDLSDC